MQCEHQFLLSVFSETDSSSFKARKLSRKALIVPCDEAGKLGKCSPLISNWLFCNRDYYSYSVLPVVSALFGLFLTGLDTVSDVMLARKYFIQGHVIWGSLTVSFVALPIVFALGYRVLYHNCKWYEVHPVGPIYWSVRIILINLKQRKYGHFETPEEAIKFAQASREMMICQERKDYSFADEKYLESYPQLVLQAHVVADYLIPFLTENANIQHLHLEYASSEICISIVTSVLSVLSYEALVIFDNMVSIKVDTLTVPNMLRIGRMILDAMYLGPRLMCMVCLFAVEPKHIIIPAFWIVHMAGAYVTLSFLPKSPESKYKLPYRFRKHILLDAFRGYYSMQSTWINLSRTAAISILLPPSLSWKETLFTAAVSEYLVERDSREFGDTSDLVLDVAAAGTDEQAKKVTLTQTEEKNTKVTEEELKELGLDDLSLNDKAMGDDLWATPMLSDESNESYFTDDETTMNTSFQKAMREADRAEGMTPFKNIPEHLIE
ncbi:uncharacterized protein LOC129581588 [Paramacrobiotus metropolitanus]|uniref:uncharacterized protein LOC129581588 n=1 Tax=Paramacrobiotus metropolitanus TaxID=2943436 RepID=UPI0024462A0E|nr:uncharacterized protein LOC129581588 [Paramacrobiotus metropolitanus]